MVLSCCIPRPARFTGEAGRNPCFDKVPSLVNGLLATLSADIGRDGGLIGLCTIGLSGAKKLDLLLSVLGVEGAWKMLSIVRSDSESREDCLTLGVTVSSGLCLEVGAGS